MMFAAIWAQNQEGVIGKEGVLPWHIPNDLKFFKLMTQDSVVILGRKTFEGMNQYVLPDRTMIVLTRQEDYSVPEGVLVYHHWEDIVRDYQDSEQLVFVMGGADIYRQTLSDMQYVFRTVIDYPVIGDAYAPPLDDHWKLIARAEGSTEEQVPHYFEMYERQ